MLLVSFPMGLARAERLPSTTVRVAAAGGATESIAQRLARRAAQEALGALLDNQLPLKLDANTVLPTVATLPGGEFRPMLLKLTPEAMNKPLPPGDYVIRAFAYCSEYSVHRPGNGVPYQAGPIQGKAADAIAMLLWSGTIDHLRTPRELQAVSWAIQSGITYAKMPKSYRDVVDVVIPDYRHQLNGDFFQNLEDVYETRAKSFGLPPLDTLLANLGKPGELALAARKQRKALLAQNTSDQIRDQTLFVGQETRLANVKAEVGPWTEKIPGVAYVRYRVVGGNLKPNNEIHLRILPPALSDAGGRLSDPLPFVSDDEPSSFGRAVCQSRPRPPQTSPRDLASDAIGYSVSRAAQVLYFVPVPTAPGKTPAYAVGEVTDLNGSATLTHDGSTLPLFLTDGIPMGSTLSTGPDSRLHIRFADETTLTMGPNSQYVINEYTYDPAQATEGRYTFTGLLGEFMYWSGLIKDPTRQIETVAGWVGIRGTEFIGTFNARAGTAELHLISGVLEIKPRRRRNATIVTAPVTVVFNATTVRTSPLTHEQYDAAKARFTTGYTVPPEIRR